MDIQEKIINYSKKIDIDKIGFCSTKPFFELEKRLERRKAKGYMCELESTKFNRQIYPELTMDNAKSFIVILEAFSDQLELIQDNKLRCKISFSAVYEDYHTIVMNKLKKLETYIQSEFGCKTQCFVDISPFSDREIAKRAGLGWIGKSGMFITEEFGSRFFIGYILTDFEIVSNDPEPLENKCGECNRCVKACPTGAVLGTGEINSTVCVSYLTQRKTSIPHDLKDKMGQQIYGCDRCQKACPYNKNTIDKSTEPLVEHHIEFETILNLSNKEFKETFGKTSSGWRGKKLLQRNAIIALGNTKDQRSLEILEKYIFDIRKDIRSEIVHSIEKINDKKGISILNEMLNKEKEEDIRLLIEQAISNLEVGGCKHGLLEF